MGDPTKVATTAEYQCWLWQTTRREDTANEDTQFEQWGLAIEADAAGALDGSATVVVDGVTYQLYGPPWTALNPRTSEISHLEATVRRTS